MIGFCPYSLGSFNGCCLLMLVASAKSSSVNNMAFSSLSF